MALKKIPVNIEQYSRMRENVSLTEVSLGYRTVCLLTTAQLEDAQVGYSIDSDGESLVDSAEGAWHADWLVIATEDETGDPIFADLGTNDFPVYTAQHGDGYWEPDLIAENFQEFVRALHIVQKASHNRETPVALENNPLTAMERKQVLKEINSTQTEFWESWLGL